MQGKKGEVMWPQLVANKLTGKRFGSRNFAADYDDEYEERSFHVHRSKSEVISINDNLDLGVYKVFVSTWNVGGVRPNDNLNLEDWLGATDNSYDIYVLGFQEVVPLSAGNVLGGGDKSNVSSTWNSLIRSALNKTSSIGGGVISEHNKSTGEKQKVYPVKEQSEEDVLADDYREFQCVVSKQMVGIMVSVWVRRSLRRFIRHASVSCVGCGLIGCLGNKGSVSVRFLLHGTSFCFVCSHLASGGKEGDEIYRNSDAFEIMTRTKFPGGPSMNLPRDILSHDRVIWLGDLNYRISLPESKTRSLIAKCEWQTLHENDQLRAELSNGGVFEGWNEGVIEFAPTYKYSPDSDKYHGWSNRKVGEKKRAPAWCDRILWHGKSIELDQYERGENKLSDHRPVRATFKVIAEVFDTQRLKKDLFSSERFEKVEDCYATCAREDYDNDQNLRQVKNTTLILSSLKL